MKKLFVIVAIVIACVSTSKAQGKWTLDMNFNPSAIFDASADSMFSLPGLKARYFKSDDVAYRIGVYYSFNSSKVYNGTNNDVDNKNLYTKSKSSSFTFAPGIEKHFKEGKLSVFIGGELPLTFSSSKKTNSYYTNLLEDTYTVSESTGGSFSLGLDFVLGFDYYIFEKLYVGAEFTPGLTFTNFKDDKTDGTITSLGGTKTTFGLSSTSGVRIGFRF